jgi:hypothetical protein
MADEEVPFTVNELPGATQESSGDEPEEVQGPSASQKRPRVKLSAKPAPVVAPAGAPPAPPEGLEVAAMPVQVQDPAAGMKFCQCSTVMFNTVCVFSEPLLPDIATTAMSEWRDYIESRDVEISVEQLQWDEAMKMGQIRRLNRSISAQYKSNMLRHGAPVRLVDCLVKRLPSMQHFSLHGFPCNTFSPHTGGKFVVLGGQHICAAVKSMRDTRIRAGQAVEDTLSRVRAVVLKATTPLWACMAGAGFHQQTQQDSTAVTPADVLQGLLLVCANRLSRQGSPYLSDDELYSVLQNHGLLKNDPKLVSKQAQDVNLNEATEFAKKQVYHTLHCRVMDVSTNVLFSEV